MTAPRLRSLIASALLAACLFAAAPSLAAALTLEEALAALSPTAERGGTGASTAVARVGRELKLPDCDHLPLDIAARLHVQWRFFEVILADLRHASLNEHMAMAFGAFERARTGAHGAAPTELDALELRYLDLRSRRDAMMVERRMARRHLAVAIGRPELIIDEALEPPPGSLSSFATSADVTEEAPTRLGGSAVQVGASLALERATLEVEQRRASGRALLGRRMDAAFARVDEARTRLESGGQAVEFGHAMAHSVDARADWLAGEYQMHLLHGWIEATRSRHLSSPER